MGDGPQRSGPTVYREALEPGDPELGDDTVGQVTRHGDRGRWIDRSHDPRPAPPGRGRRKGQDRHPAGAQRGPNREVGLAPGARDDPAAGHLGPDRAVQGHLDSRVDGHEVGDAGDDRRPVGVTGGDDHDPLVAVDPLEQPPAAEHVTADVEAPVERLAGPGESAGLDQVDAGVADHAAVEPEVPVVDQLAEDSGRDGPDPELESGPVGDVAGHVARDGPFPLTDRLGYQLGERVVDVDQEVEVVAADLPGTVDVRHLRVDLGHDERCGADHVDAGGRVGAEAEPAVGTRGADLDEGDVGRERAAGRP